MSHEAGAVFLSAAIRVHAPAKARLRRTIWATTTHNVPAYRRVRMGMKKALPKECLAEMQNPHRWIAPRGAAARPEGLEPPTF